MSKTPIQLVIADDNRFFCEALRDSLNQHKELNVISYFTQIQELITFTSSTFFDVLILDVNFNGMSSLDFISKIRTKEDQFKIISLTTLNNEYIKRQAIAKGVNFFIGKDSDLSLFKDVILKCVKTNNKKNIPRAKKIRINNMMFTERKLEILQALYTHSNKKEKALSELLNISIASLKSHKRELFEITNTSNSNELIKFGIQHGIIVS